MTPETDTILQQAFGLALSSRFASGAVSARYRTQGSVRESSESELILCNLSVRRDLFLSHGGFDERLYPNEENELLDRMRLSGVKLLHDPDLAIRRSQRKSLRAFVRQIFGYGRGRGRQTFISRSVSLPTLVPFFFLLYLLSFTVLHNPVYYIPLLCYLMGDAVFAAADSIRGKRPLLGPLLFFLYPVQHLSYGAGFLCGLAASFFRRPALPSGEVTVRKVL